LRNCKRGLITYRRQLDELWIWEGSDFDVEGEIAAYVEKERSPLVKILSEVCPLKPWSLNVIATKLARYVTLSGSISTHQKIW